MVKYIEWGKHLRLGNWLFLYAGLTSILKDTDNQLCLPDRYFLWKYLQNPPVLITSDNYDEIFHFRKMEYTVEEKQWCREYFIENKNRVINVNLGSNLQDERWFIDDKQYVIDRLKIKDEYVQRVRDKYSHIFTKPTIGIGIRRGDFVGHGDFFQIPERWYEDALIANFPDWLNYNIVIFSDDIDWCKNYYKGKPYLYAEPNNTHTHANNFKNYHNDPMDQYILATQMNNFIGGNSTFSWWNMWWVKNVNEGKVVHCGENLSHTSRHYNNPDYYPKDWIHHKI